MVRPPREARIASRTVVIWMVLVLIGIVAAENPKATSDLVKHWSPMQQYLSEYGYLTSSPEGADNLRTEEKLREAIRRMQNYGGVPQTGIVDAPTLALLERKRCGMPDLTPSERVRRYAIQGQKWPKVELTWSVKQFPRGGDMDSGMVRRELMKAFKVWSNVSLLSFTEVGSMDADIIVSFERGQHGDGYAFDGRGVVLAHAFFPGEGIGGDAHFDAEEPWVSYQPDYGVDGVRLFAVAAHEFGHSLGLSHSSVQGALMNPFYQTIKDSFQLPYDDTIAIQKLYGQRNPTRFAPLFPNIPQTSTRRPIVPTYRPASGPRGSTPRTPPVRPTARVPTHDIPSTKPSKCNTTFDAISVIRSQLFIFKGKYFWRFENKGLMGDNYPVELDRLWKDDELQHVDAVYERPIDTKIVFFSGSRYWLFDPVNKVQGFPRPLTDLGLPPDLKRIDAAFVWGHNGKTYLFSGKQYWRYDETEGRVELDYPRDMSMWRGVPYNIDAAFQNTDGYTYFFKGRKFWQFQDNYMRVKKNKFSNINQYWFGCPSRSEHAPDFEDSDQGTHKDTEKGTHIEEEEEEEDSDQDNHITSGHSRVVLDLFLVASFLIMFLLQRTAIIS